MINAAHWQELVTGPRRHSTGGMRALVDIGTSKICCYIAQIRNNRGFEIVGRGYQAAEGLQAGNVVDPQAALESVLATVQEAEEQANEQLRSVDVVWNGGDPQIRLIAMDRDLGGRQVQQEDIEEMMEIARNEAALDGRISIKVTAVDACLDGGKPLSKPVGVAGETLTLRMSLTSVDRAAFDELHELFRKAHLDIESVSNGMHASAVACLSREEAQNGALVIDMGGGTTSIVLVHCGNLIHAENVPYGGDHVSRDVAIGLKTSEAFGERLKSLYGSVQQRSCDDNMWIDVPSTATPSEPASEVPRSRLTMIVRARVGETFKLLQERLAEVMPLFDERPPRAVVLTGGACQIEGMIEMAEELFGLPARIARQDLARGPRGPEDQPCCSAACGGLVMATFDDNSLIWKPKRETPAWSGGFNRVQRWLKENFAN